MTGQLYDLAIASLPYLYSGIAPIAIAGYLPQIFRLAKSTGNSQDISLMTWWIWLSTWIISLLYGVFVLADWRFCLIAIVNVVGHLTVIGFTAYNRYFRNKPSSVQCGE